MIGGGDIIGGGEGNVVGGGEGLGRGHVIGGGYIIGGGEGNVVGEGKGAREGTCDRVRGHYRGRGRECCRGRGRAGGDM